MNTEQARSNMIDQQVRAWEVLDNRVLDVLASVPRERFAPPRYRNLAFADLEIPLGKGQVMMAPKVEGRMLQALDIHDGDRCLEIGTGSGFITACLSRLGGEVESVEIFADLVEGAQPRLSALGVRNFSLAVGDAGRGWRAGERFDAIAVTGSLPEHSPYLEEQLQIGGRLFAIVGSRPVMSAMLVRRTGEHEFSRQMLFETDLPPLLNVLKRPVFTL